MPAERWLLIGCLSAHVTAATVHVLSRVSPVTLALNSIINVTSVSVTRPSVSLFRPFLPSPYLSARWPSATVCLRPSDSSCFFSPSHLTGDPQSCFLASCPATAAPGARHRPDTSSLLLLFCSEGKRSSLHLCLACGQRETSSILI